MVNENAWLMGDRIKEKWPSVVYGENVKISNLAILDGRAKIVIGNNCTICERVKILTHDYSPVMRGLKEKVAEVKIFDDVFIGIDSIILPGVYISDNIVIGAGSVVRTDIYQSGVYAGNPVERISDF